MRSKKALLNAAFAMAGYMVLTISNIVTRSVFIDKLGGTAAGIDTTFKNLLLLLSLAELGLSTGLIYKLYHPLERRDHDAIKRVLNFYKRAYLVIAAVILAVAAGMACLVPLIVKERIYNPFQLGLLFFLYAGDTVASYLFANRKALLTADQRNYLVNRNDAAISLVSMVAQVALLYVFQDFFLYLGVKIVCRLLGATLIGRKFKQLYPEVARNRSRDTISGDERRDLTRNMGAMLFHRIGGVSVTASGVVILTPLMGAVTTGFYGNYTMIVVTLGMMVAQIFGGVTASFGNLTATHGYGSDTVYRRFNLLYFVNFAIYSFCTASLAVLIQPFIGFWIKIPEAVFPYHTVVLLLCYFYVFGIRRVVLMAKDSAGLFRPDRYMALVEAALNIGLSILFIKLWGVDGLILANTLSMLIVPMWTQPYMVYKHILKRPLPVYYLKYLLYAGLTAACAAGTYWLAGFIRLAHPLPEMALKALLCLVLPNLVTLAVFCRSQELRDLWDIARRILRQRSRK